MFYQYIVIFIMFLYLLEFRSVIFGLYTLTHETLSNSFLFNKKSTIKKYPHGHVLNLNSLFNDSKSIMVGTLPTSRYRGSFLYFLEGQIKRKMYTL